MHRKLLASSIAASAALALSFALAAPSANGAAPSAPMLQPSPRPTLMPTATALPTATPWPSANPAEAPQYGHITGTVIDARTGAPTSGMQVKVGDDIVISDVSGNYDHWMLVGSYTVSLLMADAQDIPEVAAATVAVTSSGTTVQHLSFRSPAPAPVAQATAAPTAEPIAAPAAPAVAPVVAAPVIAPAPVTTAAAMPDTLPTTGSEDQTTALWLWLALACVGIGGLLGMRPVRLALLPLLGGRNHGGDSRSLLHALLTAAPRRTRGPIRTPKADAVLLEDLLKRDE